MKRKKTKSKIRKFNKTIAKKFSRCAAKLIKRHWNNAVIKLYEEKIGIKNPDIEIEINGIYIPVEVKYRTHGYFFMPRADVVCWDPVTGVSYSNYELKKKYISNYGKQVLAMLKNYHVSLFLVRCDVHPISPCYKVERSGLSILSNFTTMEKVLDMAYEFKKERNLIGPPAKRSGEIPVHRI